MKNQTGTNTESHRSTTDKVKDRVGDAAETVQETASHVAAEAKDKGEHLIDEGRDKVHELGEKAGVMARSRATEEKDRLATGIRTVADVLRRGSEELSGDRGQYRPMLTSAADRVENISSYLETRDIDALTTEVRRFAREHTPLFLGGAFALGFAGARFLKSSGEHAARERAGQYLGSEREERFDRMLPDDTSRSSAGTSGYGTAGSFRSSTGSTGFQADTGLRGSTGSTGYQADSGLRGTTDPTGFQANTGSRSSTDPTDTTGYGSSSSGSPDREGRNE